MSFWAMKTVILLFFDTLLICSINAQNPVATTTAAASNQTIIYQNITVLTYVTVNVSFAICFPKNARVQLSDLSMIKVSDLKPGHYIRTYDHSSKQIVDSRFIDFLHFDRSALFKFISIKTDEASVPSLEISEYHLIQRLKRDSTDEHEFVFAKDLVKGDKLFLLTQSGSMKYAEITELDEVYEQGAYAPLTEHGTLIVNNVLASCYANTYSHELAHFGFGPYRFWSRSMTLFEKQVDETNCEKYWNPFATFYIQVVKATPLSYLAEL